MSDLRISRDEMAEALDQAWSSFVADTGCFPDCLTLWKSKGVIAADFHRGNFAQMVADWLNRTIPSVPGTCSTRTVSEFPLKASCAAMEPGRPCSPTTPPSAEKTRS